MVDRQRASPRGVRDDAALHVQLLVIQGCPGATEASRLLRTALDDFGLTDTGFTVTVVDSHEAPRSCGFAASPTFRVDGVDLFGTDDAPGSIACRVYSTPAGPRNVPSLRDLHHALEQRATAT